MGLTVELIEQNARLGAPHGEAIVSRLFERLFQQIPTTTPLFMRRRIKAQPLLPALKVSVFQLLHRPDTSTATLDAPGGGSVFGIESRKSEPSTFPPVQASIVRRKAFHEGGSHGHNSA